MFYSVPFSPINKLTNSCTEAEPLGLSEGITQGQAFSTNIQHLNLTCILILDEQTGVYT